MNHSLKTHQQISQLKKICTIENAIYLSLFLCAGFLRFLYLGRNPLSSSEASLALSALKTVGDNVFPIQTQPLYLSITSLIFLFFGSSNFGARFLPALIGSFLCLTPILYKKLMDRRIAILMGIFLVFDPAAISASRQADSLILTLVIFLCAIGFLINNNVKLGGIFSGLLLLCGPGFWQLFIILIPMTIIFYLFGHRMLPLNLDFIKFFKLNFQKFLFFLFCTLIFVGTSFFTKPIYLSLIFSSAVDYFRGWLITNEIFSSAGFGLICFVSSYPLFIILMLAGFFRMRIKNNFQFTISTLWIIIALLLLLSYPIFRAIDLIWIIFPLYLISASVLWEWFDKVKTALQPSALISIPALCLFFFAWLGIIRIINFIPGSVDVVKVLLALIGSVFLMGLIFILIAWGWSLRLAFNGLVMAVLATLSIYQLSTSFHSLMISPQPEQEIWGISDYFEGANLLKVQEENISEWNNGQEQQIQVQLSDQQKPSVQWLFRDEIMLNENLNQGSTKPTMIISQSTEQSLIKENYFGQKFVLRAYPYWKVNLSQSLFSVDFLRWIFLRDGYINKDTGTLWVRSDLFIGNISNTKM